MLIAADNVAKAPPDGYSVLLGNIGSHALVPHLYAKPSYDALTDLETVAWIGTQPNLLACNPAFPHDTLPKLIEAAKKEGKVVYYTSIDLPLAEKIETGTRLSRLVGGALLVASAVVAVASLTSTTAPSHQHHNTAPLQEEPV